MERNLGVLICGNNELLRLAQRLRYDVYCEELKRSSPYADHNQRVIADDLDRFGCTFLAVEHGQPIGSIRINFSSEGSLGSYERWYGLERSEFFPHGTGIATKLVVKKSKRGSSTAIKLMSSAARYFTERGGMEAYMDCVSSLIPYYLAIGWMEYGHEFDHPENGPSQPMRLDRRGLDRLAKGPSFLDYVRLYSGAKLLAWRKRKTSGQAKINSSREDKNVYMA
jgi:hypothetical protein